MPSEPLHVAQASSFGGHARSYAEHRPDYPDAAVTWALEPIADCPRPRILDLGAGTGKLTGVLLRHSPRVVAVEPDDAMRTELTTRFPDAEALRGTAEDIPLADGSVDAVLVGQAMHWFDLGKAVPEMARVLRLGGVVGGLWNTLDDRRPWVHALLQAAGNWLSFQQWRPLVTELAPPFTEVEQADFQHAQSRTAKTMTETLATHSQILVLTDKDRRDTMRRVAAFLQSCPETAAGEFSLPIVTKAVRSRRG
jgi:SAM-dependent methyltransferase